MVARSASMTDSATRQVSTVQQPLRPQPLANGPYRVVPGTTLIHVADDRWIVEAPGTRRQDDFVPLERAVFAERDLPDALAPGRGLHPEAGRQVTNECCSEQVLAALLREQAVVRAPQDLVVSEDELQAAIASGVAGVQLIAMGKPNYGRLAAALVETIKLTSPQVPVSLAWSGDVLPAMGEAKRLFDHVMPIDAVLSGHAERHQPFFVKLCADKLTPFERTLFIDVDSLLYPEADLRKEFWRYAGHAFVPTTSLVLDPGALRPGAAYLGLGAAESIVRYFGLTQPMLQMHSYYFYFEKQRAKPIFECARHVYRMIAADPGRFKRHLTHGGLIADELAFGVATSLVGVAPYFEQHQPIAESGLFYDVPERGLETCYLGFSASGYVPSWFAHYRQTLERHGLGHTTYELEKDVPQWLLELQRLEEGATSTG
jgi:hypothetical protein